MAASPPEPDLGGLESKVRQARLRRRSGLRRQRVFRPTKATQDDKSGKRDHREMPERQPPAEHAVAAREVQEPADPLLAWFAARTLLRWWPHLVGQPG
jgi:hypothetical protein